MTDKQKILLFLIACKPGIRDIYKMVSVYHRASFNFQITENLQPLLYKKFIIVSKYFDNNTPNEYEVTARGIEFLTHNFNYDEAIRYIKTLENPDQLLLIFNEYFNRNEGR